MKSKRECRKCGEIIPNRLKIGDKYKNLQNRKFCLKCSPFGAHNTKSDDPSRPSRKGKGPYSTWSEKAKKGCRKCVYKRGHDRKLELVKMAGGSCKRCGYDKSPRALTFHHLDPSKKNFGLTVNNLWSKKWETIVEEFNKCEMYCQNCHAELEYEKKMKDPNYYRNLYNF
jgi:hypothetical protein